MGREARARVAKAETTSISLSADSLGLPGERQRFIVRPRFADGDPRNDIPVAGRHGAYRVVVTLRRPGALPLPEREVSFDATIAGDSHLAIAPPALAKQADPNDDVREIKIYLESSAGKITFTGFANKKGFLGRIETELEADSLVDAEHRAYRALAPTLSNWATHLDIPVHVWRIHVTALENSSVQITAVNSFNEAPLVIAPTGSMSEEFRNFISLYREALESNSPPYQFLCLFKIAEAILKRRNRLAVEAHDQGASFTRPVERIPIIVSEFEPWLGAIYPIRRNWDEMALSSIFPAEARGRKCKEILDKELTQLRLDVAHALSSQTGAMTMSADEALHTERVNKWLGLTKCIVRRMLKNEFPTEFLPFLLEDGSIVDPPVDVALLGRAAVKNLRT